MSISDLKLSLKAKIIGGVVLLMALVSVFVFIYFPARQNAQMLQARYDEANRLVTILSHSVVAGLEFEDMESIGSSLEGAKSREDLVAIRVMNKSGQQAYLFESESVSEFLSDNDKLMTEADVISAGNKIGSIEMVFSLEDVRAEQAKNQGAITIVSIILIGIGIGFGWYMSRMVLQPIVYVNGMVQQIAEGEGDLTKRLLINSQDEIGEFSDGFNRFLDKLVEIIRNVREATDKVTSTSSEITSISVEMASGAEEQAGQTSEVAASVQEMTAAIVQNSKNANQTADISTRATDKAEEGTKAMKDTREGMDKIVASTSRTSEIVSSLSGRAEQIGEIIQVIDEIADQTNLLALNAAIEAARAGEQGRGFAVVADEVRKLAERTTKATKQIADTIRAIQNDTKEASESMLEANNMVQEGKDAAAKTEEVLSEIVNSVAKSMDMIRQIATASEEQSTGAEEISKNVESIKSVTSEAAVGAEKMARAAEGLNGQTDTLKNLVNRFKLEASGSYQDNSSDFDVSEKESTSPLGSFKSHIMD